MPIHDWSKVDAGVFHGFHLRWIANLTALLNNGILPPGYYADAEQYADRKEADVLTLHDSDAGPLDSPMDGIDQGDGGTAVLVESLIGVRTARKGFKPRARQRRLIVRHVTGHRVVAMLEIVLPGNKDRRRNAYDFAGKVANAVEGGIHVTFVDLFPATPSTPNGLHNLVWREFDREPVPAPSDRPLTLAAFVASEPAKMLVEFRVVGDELPKFLLAISSEVGAMLPLADTYAAAFAGSPPYLRDKLSQAVPGG
jgi:hypothetical protein